MQLGGKVPAKEHKKIRQMVTKAIWHTNNIRKTTRRRDFWKYTVALEGGSALIRHSSAYRSVKHICHAIRLSTK